jgi:hypothetical protein
MAKYGVNKVRGGSWCKLKMFSGAELDVFIGNIGHTLEMGYEQVRDKIINLDS